jgi:hypothetical protein
VHVEDWLEEASYVYIAPEAIANRDLRDEVCDIFSLGALAFHIFSNQPPAPNLRELHEILSHHQGLPLPAVLDGAGPKLAELIRDATHPDSSPHWSRRVPPAATSPNLSRRVPDFPRGCRMTPIR